MFQTLEATVDRDGRIILRQPIRLPEPRRALVIILDEPAYLVSETALLSEGALEDWSRPEEEEAWVHLQPGK